MKWGEMIQRVGRAWDTTGQVAAMERMEKHMGGYQITVRHHFSAGHRIPGLPGPGAKCANIHGHTFTVAWTFAVPDTSAGTLEFASMKKVLRGWVDEVLDHGFIVGRDDRATIALLDDAGSKYHVVDTPPTTEAIAGVIARATRTLLPDADLLTVRVGEGPNNEAAWTA